MTHRRLFVVCLLLIAVSGYLGYRLWRLERTPSASRRAENALSRVAKLMVLPQDEQPTIATVTDPEALKSQLFFAKAKAGDVVLIYMNSKKAILYDPTANKIVEVAPISNK